MADHTAESRITLHPHSRWVRVFAGDTLIADTHIFIEWLGLCYPHCQCVLCADVDMSMSSVFTTVTHCPFKGDTTYYSLPYIDDLAWSYKQPIDEMQAIAGRLAFGAGKMTEQVE